MQRGFNEQGHSGKRDYNLWSCNKVLIEQACDGVRFLPCFEYGIDRRPEGLKRPGEWRADLR
jgi:hypothetical protein